jgi:hypothetical protein
MRIVSANDFVDDDLHYLVRNCPALQSLSLRSSLFRPVSHVGLRTLTNLDQSLEEFSFHRSGDDEHSEEYYTQTAAALLDVLRRCSRLHKVSLIGDSLRSVNLEELLPYGHLFHELNFRRDGQMIADIGAISSLVARCSNLRRLGYRGCEGDEQDPRLLTAIHQSCPLLEELTLWWFSFTQQERIAGAGSFALINRNCKHLRVLTLGSCELSTSILRSIAGMETLESLTLRESDGITDAGMAVLATMKLVTLVIIHGEHGDGEWSGASLQPFVGSNISQTLESFHIIVRYSDDRMTRIDDVQLARSLASCQNLKTLSVYLGGWDGCVFGRDGLEGLQAIATGCPLLAVVAASLTADGIHCLGTQFTNLKTCTSHKSLASVGIGSIEELQTLYPAVEWDSCDL